MAPQVVLVTRPEPQASTWAADLQSHGLDAIALPLIAIRGPADPDAVRQLWQRLPHTRLVMFVSPAAVAWFFHLRPTDARWPANTLAAAPGPGTAQGLLDTGAPLGLRPSQLLSPSAEAQQFDSESLWPVLAPLDWRGQAVAIVSGGDQQEAKGRQWLTEQLSAQGASVTPVLSYQRGPADWSPQQQGQAAQALREPQRHIWLFSSSQAVDHLVAHALPALGLPAPAWSAVRALTTHPRIAEHCRQLGLRQLIACRPTLASVVEALRSAA